MLRLSVSVSGGPTIFINRPLLHALLLHGVAHGYGVELDRCVCVEVAFAKVLGTPWHDAWVAGIGAPESLGVE